MTTTQLNCIALSTSRMLDFCSEKELTAQIGHPRHAWPLVVLKELVDNALDACEEARIAPEVAVTVDDTGITVADNGPGIPESTIKSVLDFGIRVSSREAYVAPDRGAQGNALKTILALPYVLDGEEGRVTVSAHGTESTIVFAVDHLRQEPRITLEQRASLVKSGTQVQVEWPDSACSILQDAKAHFLQIADDYAWLNPHLTLTVDWFGERKVANATAPNWPKWGPADPTCPHWYTPASLERLICAYITHDQDAGRDRLVREFIGEFRGLAGSAKRKAILEELGLVRSSLSSLANGVGLESTLIEQLLDAMQRQSKPVKPAALGVISREHLEQRFQDAGCEMESFDYRKVVETIDGLPWILETAFGWCPQAPARRLVTGVNWSPGIVNPFRELGPYGVSLDTILSQARADRDEPVILLLHLACPRVQYTDRGKSAVVISRGTTGGSNG